MQRPATNERAFTGAGDHRSLVLRRGLLALSAGGVLLAIALTLLPKLSFSFAQTVPAVHVVRRGEFIHDISERGSLESASNVDIICSVQTSVGASSSRSGAISFSPSFKGVRVRRTSGMKSAGGSSGAGSGGAGAGSVAGGGAGGSGGGGSTGGGGGSAGGGGASIAGGGGSGGASGRNPRSSTSGMRGSMGSARSSMGGGGMGGGGMGGGMGGGGMSGGGMGGGGMGGGGMGGPSMRGGGMGGPGMGGPGMRGGGMGGPGMGGFGGGSGGGGGFGGGTMIVELIPEGTYVQPGDVLCRLDSSALEEQLVQQQIICNSSEADVIRVRNSYESTLVAKKEYLEGRYVQDKQGIESDVFVQEENLRRGQQYLEYIKQLRQREYITDVQLEQEEFAVKEARQKLDLAKIDLMVLEDYIKVMALMQLDADIKTAEVVVRAQESSHQLDLQRAALLQKQIDACTIRAPQAGQVVYVNESDRLSGQEVIIEEGALVRERQVLFRLPDPKQMLLKAKIDEARIGMVRPGMPVTIRLDAFPDKPLEGVVDKVGEYPASSSFMSSSSVKEYDTTIKIKEVPEGLRPGLSADATIRVRRIPDVLQAPVEAILQHRGRNYCILHEHENDWRLQEVEVGVTNDKVVVIQKGLQEGDRVVVGAAQYRDQVSLP